MDYLPKVLNKNRPKVKIFTTIREPLATLRSTNNFFNRIPNPGHCGWDCWGSPYRDLVNDRNARPSLETILDTLESSWNTTVPYGYQVSNPQCFELGMSLDKLDDFDYVATSLTRLDQQFDLVLLTEYYWEGIVLLRHMLCAEYQHTVVSPILVHR